MNLMFDWQQLEYILRVLLAGLCGMVLGLERKNRAKEAGTRTHFVVGCGAALIMIISKYAFFDVLQMEAYQNADIRLDPARVASTIASGIGFLGAGMIFVRRNTVKGLTTAAGIWTTSGIGMAIGAGMYVLGVSTTFIVLIAQLLLHLNFGKDKNEGLKLLTVTNVSEDNFQRYMEAEFERRNVDLRSVSVECVPETETRNYTFTIEMPETLNEDDIISITKYPSSIQNLG